MFVRLAAVILIGSEAACSLARVAPPDPAAPASEVASDVSPSPGPESPREPAATEPARAFDREVRPILASRCQPCHFEGGTVYGRLPFDRAETIRTLGVKLFTRIRDEEEREAIERFLEAAADVP